MTKIIHVQSESLPLPASAALRFMTITDPAAEPEVDRQVREACERWQDAERRLSNLKHDAKVYLFEAGDALNALRAHYYYGEWEAEARRITGFDTSKINRLRNVTQLKNLVNWQDWSDHLEAHEQWSKTLAALPCALSTLDALRRWFDAEPDRVRQLVAEGHIDADTTLREIKLLREQEDEGEAGDVAQEPAKHNPDKAMGARKPKYESAGSAGKATVVRLKEAYASDLTEVLADLEEYQIESQPRAVAFSLAFTKRLLAANPDAAKEVARDV